MGTGFGCRLAGMETMFVSYCSVTIVLSGFLYAAQSLWCLLPGLVCLGFLCRYASLCEDKKEEYVWVCGLMSVYMAVT